MSRVFTVALQINGQLGNLQGVVSAANHSLSSLGSNAARASSQASSATRTLQNQLSSLQRNAQAASQFRELSSGIAQFTQQAAQARQRTQELLQAFQRQQQQVHEMRAAFQSLQQARAANPSAISASTVSAARQELKAAERALKELERQYTAADRTSSNLNTSLHQQTSTLHQLESAFQAAGISASNLSQHEAQLQHQIQQTSQQLQRQQRFDDARQNMSQRSQDVSYAAGNFSGAIDTAKSIMSPITDSVEVYANFDATMSQVKAVTGVTGAAYDALKAKAEEMGASTQFSATEAAGAMVKLGKTGWSDAQILGGIKPLLQTAIAGGADLATTADIVSDTMSAFGKVAGQNMITSLGTQMESTQRFADVFAATASNANTDIQMMGETFKYAAATAGSLGYSVEDVALATGIMGNSGVKASMAGTALNSIMTRMAAPPADAAKALTALGVSAKKSDGSMKPFRQTIQELRGSFKNLSEAQKAEYAQNIAGTEAMKGFLALMNTADDDFEELAGAIDNSVGATDRMAATMSDNLEGSLQTLSASSEAVSLSMGKIFEPAARAAVDFASRVAGSFATFIQEHQTAVQWAGILAAGLAGVVVAAAAVQLAFAGWGFISGAVSLASAAVTAFAGRMMAFSAAARLAAGAQMLLNLAMTANPVGLAVAGIAALIGIIYAAYTHIDELKNRWETLKSALSHPIEAAINLFDHGSVVGGNVKSGEEIAAQNMSGGGSFAAPVDISAASESVNQLGNASQAAADSTNAFAQNVNANSTAAESLNQNIANIGTGAQTLNTTLTGIETGVTALQANLTGIDASAQGLNMQLPMTTAEVTNLSTSAQTATMPVQMLGTESQNATAGINQLSMAASQTAGSLSQIDGAASSVAGALSAKAAEISSIHISVPTVTATPVAANAKGGIYKQGAFLTTFAEKSPEAAIPLDNSSRAKSLWQQVGSMLGLLPKENVSFTSPQNLDIEKLKSPGIIPKSPEINLPKISEVIPKLSEKNLPSIDKIFSGSVKLPSANNKPSSNSLGIIDGLIGGALKNYPTQHNFENHLATSSLPPITVNITINGNADAETMKTAGNSMALEIEKKFRELMTNFKHEQARSSFN